MFNTLFAIIVVTGKDFEETHTDWKFVPCGHPDAKVKHSVLHSSV